MHERKVRCEKYKKVVAKPKGVNILNTKRYLKQAFYLDKLVKSDLDELENLRELATSIQVKDMSNERVQTSGYTDKTSEVAVKIADLQTKINAEIEKLICLKHEIKSRIDAIDNADFKLILQKRYLGFEKWEQIAKDMNFTYRHVLRLHNDAIGSIQDVIECHIRSTI